MLQKLLIFGYINCFNWKCNCCKKSRYYKFNNDCRLFEGVSQIHKDKGESRYETMTNILDNASVLRAQIVRKYMNSENLNIAFITQYSPELTPIEHYYSKLKQEVTDRARGKYTDWKSLESGELLKRSLQAILSSMVRRIWKSYTSEIYKSLDSF